MYKLVRSYPIYFLICITAAILILSMIFVQRASAQSTEDINRSYDGLIWAPDGLGGGQCFLGGISAEDVPLDFSLGSDPLERRLALMQVLMTDFNLTPEQAAGVVGNFMWESGGKDLPPNVNEISDNHGPPEFNGGYGWAQWTGPRQVNFINYAVENGYMASDQVSATDAANYAFLKHELTTGYTETIDDLRTTSSPVDASISFHDTFERSLGGFDEIRGEYAIEVYNEFIDSGGTVTTTCVASGSATIVGEYAFPLITTKSGIGNPGIFSNGTTNVAGHPYTAYDILAEPGTPVAAFLGGVVTRVTEDRCPGRFISIYNQESDIVISYLHLSFTGHVGLGETVSVGQQIGTVGPGPNGCGTPHLHIDAAVGDTRPSCSRLNCPPQNQALYTDIGSELYETYQALPD